jgi:hypothetical protein
VLLGIARIAYHLFFAWVARRPLGPFDDEVDEE